MAVREGRQRLEACLSQPALNVAWMSGDRFRHGRRNLAVASGIDRHGRPVTA